MSIDTPVCQKCQGTRQAHKKPVLEQRPKRHQNEHLKHDPIEAYVYRQMLGLLRGRTGKHTHCPPTPGRTGEHKRPSTWSRNAPSGSHNPAGPTSRPHYPSQQQADGQDDAEERYIRMFGCSVCGSSMACSSMYLASRRAESEPSHDLGPGPDSEVELVESSTETLSNKTVEIPVLHISESRGSTLKNWDRLVDWPEVVASAPKMAYSQTTQVDSIKSINLTNKTPPAEVPVRLARRGHEVSFQTPVEWGLTNKKRIDPKSRSTKTKTLRPGKDSLSGDHRIRQIDQRLSILTSQYHMWRGLIKREKTRWKEKPQYNNELIGDSYSI